MKWIIQNNLFNEAGYERFVDMLDRLGQNYEVVKPVPFTNFLLPADFDTSTMEDITEADEIEIDDSQKIVVMGSTSLNRIAKNKGWTPGSFLNDNFHYSKWKEAYGDYLLNPDAVIGPVHSIVNDQNWYWIFVRPTEDTKSLTGQVMSHYDFDDWRLSINQIEAEELMPLHRETEIVISSAKKIWTECRVFVIGGRIATASMYKRGDMVKEDPVVDKRHMDFAQEMVHMWRPADAFVIDIADTPKGMKVIEINNINSAGFYAADVGEIINEMQRLVLSGVRHRYLSPTSSIMLI